MGDKKYLLGTEEKQEWMRDYYFAPRGNGFFEPRIVATDSVEFSAYNVAKSFYQNYPEVFHTEYISQKIGISPDEVKKRLKRMYDERLIMLVFNPAVTVYGWGLYYWVGKFKEGTPQEVKQKLFDWFQNKDDICTGYQAQGDFDFYNGNHMRVVDNLLADVIGPWRDMPEFNNIWELTDSFHDIMMSSFTELTDTEALRKKLESYSKVEEVKNGVSPRQFYRLFFRLSSRQFGISL